jgi:Tfp pilus assembly protein PilW
MKKTNAGFSLVEFSISNLATMIMLAATFTLLTMIFTANVTVSEVMTTQQNLRVAMNTITRDIVMAGTGLPTGGITVPNGDDSAALPRGGAGGSLTTPNNSIAILSPGNAVGPTINAVATDALTITAINQESPTWTIATINADGDEIDFIEDVREGDTQLFPGDLLVFTNLNGSVFGSVTEVAEDTSTAMFEDGDAMGMNQSDAEAGNIASLANDDGTYPPTIASRINMITYYISNASPEHPRLMRAVNAQAPQIIVEDVENLQFSFDLFDFETNESTAGQETTIMPNQIRSVHVSIGGRSPKVLERSNEYYRFSLVSKVNVRNATFRNRYID